MTKPLDPNYPTWAEGDDRIDYNNPNLALLMMPELSELSENEA